MPQTGSGAAEQQVAAYFAAQGNGILKEAVEVGLLYIEAGNVSRQHFL